MAPLKLTSSAIIFCDDCACVRGLAGFGTMDMSECVCVCVCVRAHVCSRECEVCLSEDCYLSFL